MPSKLSVQTTALAIFLTCAFALVMTTFRSLETALSLSWPSAKGVVTKSYVTQSRSRRGMSYTTVHLEYEYRAEGSTYRCDRISFFDWGPFSPRDSSAMHVYPVGRQVELQYNPSDPSDAVIENGVPLRAVMVLFFAIFAGSISGYVLLEPMGLTLYLRNLIGKPEDVARAGDWP